MDIKILLVGDRAKTRILKERLILDGFSVPKLVEKGAEALILIPQAKPDVVLVCPSARGQMDALIFVRKVRKEAGWEVPIIFVVYEVKRPGAVGIAALKAGANFWLRKPFSLPNVRRKIRAAVEA